MNKPDAAIIGLKTRWVEALTGTSLKEPVITVECRKQGYGILQFGRGFQEGYLKLAGKEYYHGLGSHADSEIILRSFEDMQKILAFVGVDQNGITQSVGGEKTRIVFSVEVNGKEIWRSRELNVKTEPAKVNVSLPKGTKEVLLKATAVDGNFHCSHADWAALQVTGAGGSVAIGPNAGSWPMPIPSPFSFIYGGRSSDELLKRWPRQVTPLKRGKGYLAYEITWSDPGAWLESRLVLKSYTNFPALEWIVYFKSTGKIESDILEDIQALDLKWPNVEREHSSTVLNPARVWRGLGSPNCIKDFEYLEEPLYSGGRISMAAGSGRSSSDWLPFINLQSGGLGILTAIGWTGQWACSIENELSHHIHLRAGMEKTHLRLHPGEEIRGPRILQLFWTGDRVDAHNQWRRLLMEQYVPKAKGKPVTGPFTIAHWGGMKTAEHIKRIAVYKKQRIRQEYYWIDAGWYGLNSTFSPDEHTGDWYQHTGDWRVNPRPHPNGLKPISDAVRKAGMKFLLWVEPERAVKGSYLTTEHPEWFLGNQGLNLLLNLGDEAARLGVTEIIIKLIRENRISLCRQDFNFDPLPYWRKNDAEDRQGISEIRYVTGLYAFWDELLEKVPELIIDNCAGGGRRIDLETISRSIPLWRSDWQCQPKHDPVGSQAHGMGLSYWVPLHGTGTWGSKLTSEENPTYKARSGMGPAWQFSAFPYEKNPIDPKYPWDWFRKMSDDYLRIRPSFVGDYYPLTEARADCRQWAAYQMNRPDLGEGFIMSFRRKDAPWASAEFRLRGLDATASYEMENADTGMKQRIPGNDLLEKGFHIKLFRSNTSALIFYRKIS